MINTKLIVMQYQLLNDQNRMFFDGPIKCYLFLIRFDGNNISKIAYSASASFVTHDLKVCLRENHAKDVGSKVL